MSNNRINKCLNNPFSLKLMDVHKESVYDAEKREGFQMRGNNYHLFSEKEKYTSRIFRLECDLVSTIEQIEYIKVFISKIPYKKFMWNHSIDELSYLQYHLEVLYRKVHTVLEIMKLMVNEVYMLGIKERECSWKNLKSKVGKDIEPMKDINQYYEIFIALIENRHLNSHRGYFQDEEMNKIDLLSGYGLMKLYHKAGFEMDDELKKNISKLLIDIQLNKFREDKVKLIANVLEIIYGLLLRFLESLNPEYEKNIK